MRPLPLLVSHREERQSIDSLAADLNWSREEYGLAKRLYASRIPPLVNRKCLPYLFGVSSRLIAAMGRNPGRYYRIYSVKKVTGGTRRIEAPRRFLKVIQTWINTHICRHATMPDWVIGFVQGRNIFDNGKAHAPNKNLMVVDIQDFFPSVSLEMVKRVFVSMRLPTDVSDQLGKLCCLQGRLPQGAPSSPALANIVFKSADNLLQEQSAKWGCKYTRYADDLAFSGSRRFSQKDVERVKKIIGRFGFTINETKTRIVGQGGRQIITGLVVNRNALPPRTKRRLWRAIFHRASQHPREFTGRVSALFGVASFVNQFSPELAAEYFAIAGEVSRRRA